MRRPSGLAAVALTLGVTLILGLSGCGGGAQAHAGSVVRTQRAPQGTTATLTAPSGTARVSVGKPVRTIAKDQASDRRQHRAPDGGAFVPVSWAWTFASGFPLTDLGAADQPATISLIAGGRSYRLDTIHGSFGTALPEYVAVPTTEDLKVGLTYDGLTQTVDLASGQRDAGAAEALYHPQPQTIGCGQGWQTSIAIKAPMDCRLQVATLPWAGSWASPGHEYVVVDADIRPYPLEIHRGSHYARYDVRSVTDTSTVDGVGARRPLQQDANAAYAMTGTLVFDVPTGAHALDLELDYALRKGGQTGPGTYPLDPDVTFSRSIPLS
jgi:hypothetical protein